MCVFASFHAMHTEIHCMTSTLTKTCYIHNTLNLYGIPQYKLVQIISWDLLSIATMECIARIPTIPQKIDNIVDHDLYEYL